MALALERILDKFRCMSQGNGLLCSEIIIRGLMWNNLKQEIKQMIVEDIEKIYI